VLVGFDLGGGAFAGETDEVDAELNDEAKTQQQTGNVGQNPIRVAHDLQNRSAIIVFKAGLEISEARIAQGVVHVDEYLAVLAFIVRGELDAASKVFGNIGARIFLMREIEQLDGMSLIIAMLAEGEFPSTALIDHRLRLAERG